MTAAAALARRVAALRWDAVADPVRARLRLHLLDTLGVMCAGHRAKESAAVLAVYTRGAGRGGASVVGGPGALAAADAAFCNAFLGRAHTFDDTFENGPVHPGSAVVAAALAAAEETGASGRTLLEAVLAGYEVAVRVSRGAGPGHYASGLHSTGTINAFAAAAAAARAMGLDEPAITAALGHAGGGASGLRQYQADGSLADSAVNGARAAAWGVRAAQLAAAGLDGPAGILDGQWGFLPVLCPAPDAGAIDAPGGPGESLMAVSLKPYPSCRFTHGPVHELYRLRREAGITADDVEAVHIATFRQSIDVSDKPSIETRSDAILAHQFAAACMLLTGQLTLDAFDMPLLHDPALRSLAARVKVHHDAALDARYPDAWPHRITVRLRDGRELHAMSEHPPGTAQVPMEDAEVAHKFRQLGAALLGDERARALEAALGAIDRAADMGALGAALRAAR